MNITYEQLMFALDHGEEVTFQDTTGNYIIIGGAGKGGFGIYRSSYWHKVIKECEQNVGGFDGFNKEALKNRLKNWTYISSKPTRYAPMVPIGTKVRMLENAEEECWKYSHHIIKESKNEKVVSIIQYNFSDYIVETNKKSNAFMIPRTAFTVITGEKTEMEELSTDEMIKELERRGDIQDRKVVV